MIIRIISSRNQFSENCRRLEWPKDDERINVLIYAEFRWLRDVKGIPTAGLPSVYFGCLPLDVKRARSRAENNTFHMTGSGLDEDDYTCLMRS